MPSIAGHELPTPGNADSPAQKKHREQVIVIGTIILVILTFVLVHRAGSNAQPFDSTQTGNDPNQDPYGFAGGGGAQGDPTSAELAALPGQIEALNQGSFSNRINQLSTRNAQQSARLNRLTKRLATLTKRENRQSHEISRLRSEHPFAHAHPRMPTHPIHVTTHGKVAHPKQHSSIRQHAPRHVVTRPFPIGGIRYPTTNH